MSGIGNVEAIGFPAEVSRELQSYVYRLIDPRNPS